MQTHQGSTVASNTNGNIAIYVEVGILECFFSPLSSLAKESSRLFAPLFIYELNTDKDTRVVEKQDVF